MEKRQIKIIKQIKELRKTKCSPKNSGTKAAYRNFPKHVKILLDAKGKKKSKKSKKCKKTKKCKK